MSVVHRYPKYSKMFSMFVTKTYNVSATKCRSLQSLEKMILAGDTSIVKLLRVDVMAPLKIEKDHKIKDKRCLEFFKLGKNEVVVLEKSLNLVRYNIDTWKEVARVKSRNEMMLGTIA